MNESEVRNDFARFYIKEGILHFIYNDDVQLDLSAAKLIVEDRLRLQNNVSFPVLCDIRGLKGADKAARDFLANEGSILTIGVGLIVDSPALKIMTNFYMLVNKPKVPTKVFRTELEAIDYLKTLVS